MSQLAYPFGETVPAVGTTLDVARGVRWLRMPLPFALDHVNLWLLRDRQDGRDGWAIVDCGIANDATRAAWEQLFANGLEGLPVLRVIVTHLHPDHVGLADWLTRRWSTAGHTCPLWMSATDWHAARLFAGTGNGTDIGAVARFLARHGLTDPVVLGEVSGRRRFYADGVPDVPGQYHRLMDGLVLDIGGVQWRCIAGYGHAPEHIALHSAELDLLISGDMVLPRISTNVSVFATEPEANPLELYLGSIGRMRALPPGVRVLPAHGRPFVGLHERIGELEAHHEARLADVRSACRTTAHSAAELLPVLFHRQLDAHQTAFAMGEAIAHLHLLAARGEMRAVTGTDGVVRFAMAA
ncbi:MAG: MBL fold metallo-hydrolase [Gammaproteobacteria bacterium]|nr:MBL fold metallo-hydrolase [Gammaproteobacteria bacterium]